MRRFIRPLKRLSTYKTYMVLDIETTTETTPHFLFAYVLYMKDGKPYKLKSHNIFDGYFYFDNPKRLTQFICQYDFKEKSKRIVFGHNVIFDFQFLDWDVLTNHFRIVRASTTPNILLFKDKEGQKTLQFLDTMNFFKTSLEKIFPQEKVKYDFENEMDLDKLRLRCKRDVELTNRLVQRITGISASDMSFKTYRHEFRNYIQIVETPIARMSYFGGRVEAFYTHSWVENVRYYDFNSLYPSVMIEKIPKQFIRSHKDLTKEQLGGLLDHDKMFVFGDVSVEIPYMKISPCPYRLKNKLIFPIGSFRVCLPEPELKLNYEFIKKVHGVEIYSSDRIFEDFVYRYYDLRQKSSGVDRDFYKLILNSLYGKFGQKARRSISVEIEKIGVNEGYYFVSVITDKGKEDYYIFGDMGFNVKILDKHKYNVAVSSAITSYGRVKLFNKMSEVLSKNGRVLYCDTDSIFTTIDLEDSKQLGHLKLEGIGNFLAFKSKCYIFQSTVKFKGARNVDISTLDPQLEEIVVKYRKFQTLKMGLRKGNYRSWLDVVKKFNLVDDKRIGVLDTEPIRLVNGVKV